LFTVVQAVAGIWSKIGREIEAVMGASVEATPKAVEDQVKGRYLVLDAKMKNLSLTQVKEMGQGEGQG
jgi:hypothetical protein